MRELAAIEGAESTATVLIAGGGPAGLASAIALAMQGCSVRLYDAHYPRHDKACGEGLMPSGRGALTALGVALPPDSFAPLAGVALNEGSLRAEGHLGHGAGDGPIGLSRRTLIAALQQRAEAVGVDCRQGTVTALAAGATAVEYCAAGQIGLVDYAVVADGLHSRLRKQLGLEVQSRRPRRWGMRQHYALAPWSPFIEIFLAKGAEAYVTPIGSHAINVAILTAHRGEHFADSLQRFPALEARLKTATAADPIRGAGWLWQDTRPLAAERLAVVGDAAGYVDAITGEGVSLALCSALRLASALATDKTLLRYPSRVRPMLRHYAWHARLLLWLAGHQGLRRASLWLLGKSPRLFRWWLTRTAALPR